MDFVIVPPDQWPGDERARRAQILEIAKSLEKSFFGKAFGVSVEIGQEKVKAEFLPENGRAMSEYTAFGLTWQDSEEFELVEEEQRIELEEESRSNQLRHYVRVRNHTDAPIRAVKSRSCVGFGQDENCVDNRSVEDLAPGQSFFWSLEMGPMKSPDVQAWYEIYNGDGRRVMAYRQYPNNLYKNWVSMLRERGQYFESWDERGDDPQRMIKSRWTAGEKFKVLEPRLQKAEAAKLYEKIAEVLKAFFPPEQLKKEMNIAISDSEERLLLNYGSEAVN